MISIAEFQERELAKAIARKAPLFMGLPDEWYEPSPQWGCDNGHVSRAYLKSELRGCRCLACDKPVALIPPGYTDATLAAALTA